MPNKINTFASGLFHAFHANTAGCSFSQIWWNIAKIHALTPVWESTLWRPAGFENFCAKGTGLHMALHVHNSGAKSGRELFKGSRDAASLHSKKHFLLGGVDFLWVTSRVEDF